jgi:hypothetical protein
MTLFAALSGLCILHVPARMVITRVGPRLAVLRADGDYTVVLELRKSRLRLRSYSISWPAEVTTRRTYFLAVSKLLEGYLLDEASALGKIDRLLHSVREMAGFVQRVKSIEKASPDFNVRTRRRSAFKLLIEFPPAFGPTRVFSLDFQLSRTTLSSTGVVCSSQEAPPFDLTPVVSFREIPKRALIDGRDFGVWIPQALQAWDHPSEWPPAPAPMIRPFSINFSVHSDDSSPQLLSFLRDITVETTLYSVWESLSRPWRRFPVRAFAVTLIPNSRAPCSGRVVAGIGTLHMGALTIDPWDGHTRQAARPFPAAGSAPGGSVIEQAVIDGIVVMGQIGLGVHTRFEPLPILHVMSLGQMVLFSRTFSFAPDYSLQYGGRSGRPQAVIIDSSGRERSTPIGVQMESLPKKRAWLITPSVIIAMKRIIFVFQTQKCLTDLGVRSLLRGDELLVSLEGFRSCSFHVTDHGWRLAFAPSQRLPDEPAGAIYHIFGAHYSSRCSQVIASLILSIATWRSIISRVSFLTKESSFFRAVGDHNELFLKILETNTLRFRLENAFQMVGAIDHNLYFFCPPNVQPVISIQFARSLPFKHYFNRLVRQFDTSAREMVMFLHRFAVPLLRFCHIFGGIKSDWTFSNLTPQQGYCLVYRKRFTVSCRLTPLVAIGIWFSRMSPSNILLFPIHHICERTSLPQKITYVTLKMSELPQFKRLVSEFCDRITVLEKAGFRLIHVIPEQRTVRYGQPINGIQVLFDLVGPGVEFRMEWAADVQLEMKKLVGERIGESDCLDAVLTVLVVFLPVDLRLVKVVLQLLRQLALDIAAICTAMNSARIEDNGNASVAFQYQESHVYLEFPVPLNPSSIIQVQHGFQTYRLQGIDGVVDLLGGHADF